MSGNRYNWSSSILKDSIEKDLQTPQKSLIPDNNTNQDIEVSIIIPSQNRYPLNLFTLYSLEHQTFNPDNMEVIFIDDASTDETKEKLLNYSPPYHFKYIVSNEKLGRAKARNLGIRSARGRILIFLDAEMITEPDFVENHYNYHQSKDNVIVSGAMYTKALFSCIFPDFSKRKINTIADLAKNNQEIYARFQACKFPLEKPCPLLEKKDIARKTFKDIASKGYRWFQQITRNFGENLSGFAFPWMAFITGNVSVCKDLIVQAGVFDGDFYHYGYEDWELGYRLSKLGAQYIVSEQVAAYHQEHPIGERKWRETIGNFGLFTIKHHDVEVLILGLELSGLTDLLMMNNIVREYTLLVQSNPERFQNLQEKFITILETIILFLEVDIRNINILGAAGFDSIARKQLQGDIYFIKTLNEYPNLTDFLEKILKS
ncbi:glycosyltransferase [Neobacillus vireti]|uniref:Glycosyl transferase, group 2 family protein n=1 Tax=Neobacillus vireti LMG 21834 TaxID=1131730 RepID=A0AB94IGQ2_9BACI|nr:glycosyltransferase [Neobacillus vireti]ETI66290.1 glycosyl transferase, group 2 family protein [Neobacillus vireti LMG 21834]